MDFHGGPREPGVISRHLRNGSGPPWESIPSCTTNTPWWSTGTTGFQSQQAATRPNFSRGTFLPRQIFTSQLTSVATNKQTLQLTNGANRSLSID